MPPLAVPSAAPNPWFSWDFIRRNQDYLITALEQHVSLVLATMAIASVVGVGLAVATYRTRRTAAVIVGLTGVLYVVPSLALFSLLAPTLGLSFNTVLIGLVLYALIMVLRNALTGLRSVPAEVLEAAAGMGYGRFARLWRVELPLALPSIITGLRLATVSTVALVTVGYLVGFGGFGNVILTGFNNNFYKAEIMTGTLGCVLLALAFDLVLLGLGRLAMPWARR